MLRLCGNGVIQTENIWKEGEIQYSYLPLTVYYDLSRNSATSEYNSCN